MNRTRLVLSCLGRAREILYQQPNLSAVVGVSSIPAVKTNGAVTSGFLTTGLSDSNNRQFSSGSHEIEEVSFPSYVPREDEEVEVKRARLLYQSRYCKTFDIGL